MKILSKGALAALAVGLAAQGALAAGPVTVLKAPTSVIEVKNGRNGAAAVGAVGGLAAGILLGSLLAGPAQAAQPATVYVPPQDYGYEPAPPQPVYVERPPAYAYQSPVYGETPWRQELRRAAEICRRGILSAARRYGAYDAHAGDAYRSARRDDGALRFRMPIRVVYPQGQRTSTVSCVTDRGYLVSAQAVQ